MTGPEQSEETLLEHIEALQCELNRKMECLSALRGRRTGKIGRQEAGPRPDLSADQMLQLVLDTIPVRVFWKDRDSRFLGCNRMLALDAGLDSPADIVGKTDFDLAWREMAETFRADDAAVMRTGQAKLNYEEFLRAPDGRIIWLRSSKVPLRDAGGTIVGVLGTYEDITECKLAEAQQRAILDNIPDMAWLKDRRQHIIAGNEALARACGCSVEELVGKTDADLWGREQAAKLMADDQAVLETGRHTHHEDLIEFGDGRTVWYETIRTPIRNSRGELIGTAGIARDINARKRVETAMQQRILALTLPTDDVSSLRIEDLFDLEEIQKIQDAFAEATGVAAVITDLEGRPITRPSNFCRLCLEIIRKTDEGLANCMQSDAALGRLNPHGPTIQPCLSGGLWDGGTSICVGDRHIANWLIGQVLDPAQDPERMLDYGRRIGADMAAYRKALDEVTRMPREKFEKVCQALHLIARQLSLLALQNVQQARAITERKRAEERLLEADRRKDEFLAILSHELRNPLAPIRSAAQILRLAGPDDPTLQRQRQIIDRQVTHMARLLDDLLDVSRITRGKIRLKKERLDLREVVDRAIEGVHGAMAARMQSLVYHRASEPLWLHGDATRLEQVLCNLLSNAVKYSDQGHRIWLEISAEPDVFTIEVRDEGIGIAPDMLPRVFDMFAQATQSLDRSQGGLGLGLTLVKQLAEMHGGSVKAASAGLGQGSTFTVRLPRKTAQDGIPDDAYARIIA